MTVQLRHLLLGASSLTLALVSAVTVACASARDAVQAAPATAATHVVRTATASPVTGPAPLASRRVSSLQQPLPRPRTRPAAASADPWARFGFDISWPQCRTADATLPPSRGTVAIVGLTGGRPFTKNPCLAAEWSWAKGRTHSASYLNLDAPGSGDPAAWGAAATHDGLARASSAGIDVRAVWLDVESSNHWSLDSLANRAVIAAAITTLRSRGLSVGVYSTPLDWDRITRGLLLDVPIWQALPDGRQITQGCRAPGFAGRAPDLVQAVFTAPDGHLVDGDLVCNDRPDTRRQLG